MGNRTKQHQPYRLFGLKPVELNRIHFESNERFFQILNIGTRLIQQFVTIQANVSHSISMQKRFHFLMWLYFYRIRVCCAFYRMFTFYEGNQKQWYSQENGCNKKTNWLKNNSSANCYVSLLNEFSAFLGNLSAQQLFSVHIDTLYTKY